MSETKYQKKKTGREWNENETKKKKRLFRLYWHLLTWTKKIIFFFFLSNLKSALIWRSQENVVENEIYKFQLPFLQIKSPGEKTTGRSRNTNSHRKPASVFWKISTRFKVSKWTFIAISAWNILKMKWEFVEKKTCFSFFFDCLTNK